MNPARSLGPAMASGVYDGMWVYMIAPLIGGSMAGMNKDTRINTRLALRLWPACIGALVQPCAPPRDRLQVPGVECYRSTYTHVS